MSKDNRRFTRTLTAQYSNASIQSSTVNARKSVVGSIHKCKRLDNSYSLTLSFIKAMHVKRKASVNNTHLHHFCLFHGDKEKGCKCDTMPRIERQLLNDYINYIYYRYHSKGILPCSFYQFLRDNRNNDKYKLHIYSDYDIENVHLYLSNNTQFTKVRAF